MSAKSELQEIANKLQELGKLGLESQDTRDPLERTLQELADRPGFDTAAVEKALQALQDDEQIAGKIRYNEFTRLPEVHGVLPWALSPELPKVRPWADFDQSGLNIRMAAKHQVKSRTDVQDALTLYLSAHRYHPVREYLQSLGSWDGQERLDTLLVRYLGAQDSEYNRAVTRKAFTAAVARVMRPGCKFDSMLVLSGPQGIGKSSLIAKVFSPDWVCDSIRTFEGKDAAELLQGAWGVEICEFDAFRYADIARIKQFLTIQVDRYRPAYGRIVELYPRQCVFFGTTNKREFLTDTSGNRRFWPVDCAGLSVCKVWTGELELERDQLWAEALHRYDSGESLLLEGVLAARAQSEQETHRVESAREGLVRAFLDRLVPEDWQEWGLERRLDYWRDPGSCGAPLVPRKRVCALEIWCEAFGKRRGDITRQDTREINEVLEQTEGWERCDGVRRFGYCGHQRGFQTKAL